MITRCAKEGGRDRHDHMPMRHAWTLILKKVCSTNAPTSSGPAFHIDSQDRLLCSQIGTLRSLHVNGGLQIGSIGLRRDGPLDNQMT